MVTFIPSYDVEANFVIVCKRGVTYIDEKSAERLK